MSNVMKHLQNILAHGPRMIGSPANQACAGMIREAMAGFGLAVEEQPYPCTRWVHEGTRLAQGAARFEAQANPFSPACDVTAAVVSAGTPAELEALEFGGRVLALYGDLAKYPLSPWTWFLRDERDTRVFELLRERKPAALLGPPAATEFYSHLTYDWDLDLPAATTTPAGLRRILRQPGVPVSLRIAAHNQPAEARNIIGRTPGLQGQGERLVVCAHFDTTVDTPGASDNAGGVAVLLALAEALGRREHRPGIEFLAINGEEYLPLGDDEYLRRSEGYFSKIRGCLNMDGAGGMLSSTSVTCMAAPQALEAGLRRVASAFPGVVWVDPWPESNHSTFAMRGVPAVAISAVGTRGVAHFPHDDLEGMSEAKLEEVLRLAQEVIRVFSGASQP